MKIVIISTSTNIFLDVVFVGFMKLGTGGAAAATVIFCMYDSTGIVSSTWHDLCA